jgi:hypothetical protein
MRPSLDPQFHASASLRARFRAKKEAPTNDAVKNGGASFSFVSRRFA